MTTKDTILIADDDPSLRTVLSALLQKEGFNVVQAVDGLQCLRVAYEAHPNLVLLDIMMPNKDGHHVCQRLREISGVPIIMLTGVSVDTEKVALLNGGADDYITKPFNNNELVARIRTVLRRGRQESASRLNAYHDAHLSLNFEGRKARVAGNTVALSPKEWRLLECLVKHEGRAVSREVLLRYAWGESYEKEFNYLKVFVSHLRHKLGDPTKRPRYIHTERELGYRFEGPA